jgi:hypothetical protein
VVAGLKRAFGGETHSRRGERRSLHGAYQGNTEAPPAHDTPPCSARRGVNHLSGPICPVSIRFGPETALTPTLSRLRVPRAGEGDERALGVLARNSLSRARGRGRDPRGGRVRASIPRSGRARVLTPHSPRRCTALLVSRRFRNSVRFGVPARFRARKRSGGGQSRPRGRKIRMGQVVAARSRA